MLLPRKVKVTQIDHWGFCGRDPHPDEDLVGQVCTVLSMEIVDAEEAEPDMSYGVFTVRNPLTLDLIELMEHEVEWVTTE